MQLCGSLSILWHYLSLELEWKLTFSSPVATAEFYWHIECSTFTASSSRVWNSSTGIPSPPPALSIVMFPKAHLICILWCLALGEWSHYHGYLGHEDLFLYSSSVYFYHLFLICSASVKPLLFLSFIEPIFACNVPLLSLIFLKRFLVFPNLLFSSISSYWSLKKAFLISLLFFEILHSDGYIFPLLLCLSILFFSQLFVRPYQTTILPFCISFSWGWFWS